ncbi:MAG TPA: 5'/3'-nucleotidase SurE [Marmoricola sp.]|jgi:5'-nucleotidase|nr:5'/3'-nucleotidase SurE [Marmoricola sp.]
MQLTTRALAGSLALLGVLAGSLTGLGSTAQASGSTAPSLAGLRVLITNDDSARGLDSTFGTDGKGMYELRKSLCAAGADVLVVAPWSQQSGAGARETVPGFSPVPLTVQAVSPPAAYANDCATSAAGGAVFGVCQAASPCTSASPSASPADTVNLALSRFAKEFWSSGPQVVLSGINFGQNVGATINHSGTVGAAVTAREYGVPAIALSAEVPQNLSLIPSTPFAATATYATGLLTSLVKKGSLKPGLVLNVNYPFIGAGEKLGKVVSTVIGTSNGIGFVFSGDVAKTGGTYQLGVGAASPETRKNADTTALADDEISVTTLDGDWTAPAQGGFLGVLLGLLG